MADLSGAVRHSTSFRKTEVIMSYGAHKGYFIGLGDTFVEESGFACSVCKGRATINDEPCRACKGTGKKTQTKVAIRYQMGKDLIQEEIVNYVLSEPGKMKDGTPKSASTLWTRMRAFSGLQDPEQMSEWYKSLPQPIRVPIEMMVTDNEKGDAFVIASVRRLEKKQPAPEPSEPPTDPDDGDYRY